MIKKALFISKFFQCCKEMNIKTIDEMFNNLNKLYEEMKKDESIGMENVSYQQFVQGAQTGLAKAQQEIQMEQFMGNFKF